MRSISTTILILCVLILSQIPSLAQDQKKQGPPPLLVETGLVSAGDAEPMVERIGSIRYARTSRVATEISGIVDQVFFSEGQRVKAGDRLVQLRNDLRKKSIEGTRAGMEQILVEKQRAEKELSRIKALFAKKSVSESLYDDIYYKVLGLEKSADKLKATLEKQQLELKKTALFAPFDGLILKKMSERGEWLSTGGQVALIADDRQVEAHIDAPQSQLSYLTPGRKVSVTCGGKNYEARIAAIVPQGDIATRTFTVKLALNDAGGLFEGMEASTRLPDGQKKHSLLVPRDAVVKQFGRDLLFSVVDGKAKMIPVNINGYRDMLVAVSGPDLTEGMPVITKGNERVRDGQAVRTN